MPKMGNAQPRLGFGKGASSEGDRLPMFFQNFRKIVGNPSFSKMAPLFKLIAVGICSNFG